MQKITFLLPIVALIFLASCKGCGDSEMDKMIALLKKNKVDAKTLEHLLQPDTRCAVDYLKKRKMSCNDLIDLVARKYTCTDGKGKACYDCTIKTFCSVPRSELIQNVKNYRDNVWRITSDFDPSQGGDPYALNSYKSFVKSIAVDGTPVPNWGPDKVDAQYVDIDLEHMRNYICAIDNAPISTPPNTIRAYYIRYNDNDNELPANYAKKHSICFVPVHKNAQNITTVEVLDSTFNLLWDPARPQCANNTLLFNRNMICPPYSGCYANTLLTSMDQ